MWDKVPGTVSKLQDTDPPPALLSLLDSLAHSHVIGARWNAQQRRRLWRWKYVDNPFRHNDRPSVWIVEMEDRLVGQLGAIAVQVKARERTEEAAWLADFGVTPEDQGKGAGGRMVNTASKAFGCLLGYGLSESSFRLFVKLGWAYPGSVPRFRRPLRPPLSLRPRALVSSLRWRGRTRMDRIENRLVPDAVKSFDHQADRVWERMARDLSFCVRRDSKYLNWRYVQAPGSDYQLLPLISGREHRGYVITALRGGEGHIVDLISPLSDSNLLKELVDMSLGWFSQMRCHSAVCAASDPRLQSVLENRHFRREVNGIRFLYWSGPGSAFSGTGLDDWFLMSGDCDRDLPQRQ